MTAGTMDQRVTIQNKTVTRDAYGAEVITWTDVATVWAQCEPLSGREYIAMRQAQSDITTRFRIYARAGLTTAMRVVWRGQAYNITEIIAPPRTGKVDLLGFAETVPT